LRIACFQRKGRRHVGLVDAGMSATVFKSSPTKTDAWPIVFTKVSECVVGPRADVRLLGAVSGQIGCEADDGIGSIENRFV